MSKRFVNVINVSLANANTFLLDNLKNKKALLVAPALTLVVGIRLKVLLQIVYLTYIFNTIYPFYFKLHTVVQSHQEKRLDNSI